MNRSKYGDTIRLLGGGYLVYLGIRILREGVLNGSMQDVLIKATKICTECIGLG